MSTGALFISTIPFSVQNDLFKQLNWKEIFIAFSFLVIMRCVYKISLNVTLEILRARVVPARYSNFTTWYFASKIYRHSARINFTRGNDAL